MKSLLLMILLLTQIIFPITAQYMQPITQQSHLATEPFISPPATQYGNGEFPVGIAAYAPPTIETTQWLGIVTVDSLSATSTYSSAPNSVSFQLNVVLNYEYNGNSYALWVQDVAEFNTQNDEVYILNNIWNATTPYANITGVHGNGGIYKATVNEYAETYYAYVDSASFTTLSLPATIYLLVNVTTNSQGQPVIYFWYSYGNGWVNYDVVTVTNVVSASNVYFLVQPGLTSGSSGIYYDAALIIGGPGNGTNAYINSGTVYFQLFYWNGHNFQEIPNAYTVGYDTAETVSNANTQLYVNLSNGELYAKLVVGEQPSNQNLWSPSSIAQLTIYSPVNQGYVYVYNYNLIYPQALQSAYKVPFVGGEAVLTVASGKYAILVYQNGQPVAEANIYASAGQSISTDTTQFSISLNETQATIYLDESGTVSITVKAYGNVTINVISPSSVKTSFTQETVNVNGQSTIYLTISPTQAGTYTVTLNASIFPGFYVTQQLTIIVQIPIYRVTFEYSVVGQQLPQQPQVTLQFPNGTTDTITIYNSETINVPAGTVYTFQQIISQGNVRWATQTLVTGIIKVNDTTVSATYYEQVLVNFEYNVTNGQWTSTPPTVVYYNFTSEVSVSLPAQVWVNYDSTYCYQNVTVGNERIVTNYKGVVTSPGTITADYTLQYYVQVNSQIPVYAIVNGKNASLTSGWYNAGVTIQIENITYYPSPNERYIITSISPSSTVTVNSPITIQISTVEQFYVTVKANMQFTIYALINGKNATLTSGWYNSGTTIQVENFTDYITNNTRYTIGSVTPSPTITVNSPITIAINIVKQFYVTVNSPIPVYALVNGTNVPLTSGWYDAYSVIQIENISYSPSPGVRYIIVSVSPSETIDLTSPITITITTAKQYYVTVISPIPVYALINGKNESLVSGWYNASIQIQIENIPYYISNDTRYVISSVSPSANITVSSPMTVKISVQEQFYVTLVSQYPVYALIDGKNATLTSGWYNSGTTIYIENITNYPAKGIRFFILSVEPSMNFTVSSPITVKIKIEVQYYVQVNSKIPVYAVINGKNETLKSGWYNANTTIYIENLTYYPAKGVRYLILGIQPSQKLVLTSPIAVNIIAVKQYYVAVDSPIPVYALINGKNESLVSNWYNASSLIQVENLTYYPSQGVRYVIVAVLPSETINLTSPITINVSVVKQYHVQVNSPIPVKAIINGTETYLNSSWINQGTEIQIINYTYYTNGERYIITSISSQNFTVNSSVTVNVSTEKQFLVTINGKQEWINQGETITLTANVPIYDVGEFVGTYNVSPGTTITVTSPITEKLVLRPNYVFYGTVIGVVVVAIASVLLVRRWK